MIKLSRDTWLAIGLLASLLVITAIAASQSNQQEDVPPLATFSSTPNGGKALKLWLESLDYPLPEVAVAEFLPPEETDLIFMLEPLAGIADDEWEVLDAWVEEGGTLAVVGDELGAAFAFRHYNFNLTYIDPPPTTLVAQTPLWHSPPMEPADVRPEAFFQTNRRDFVTYIAVEEKPVIVSFAQGDGQVVLSAAPFPFSNAGLKAAGNPALVLNVVSAAQATGGIWFDEWHHGLRAGQTDLLGPWNGLRYTAVGRALLFIATVIFIGLVLRGRRFGRPVPLAKELARRAPLEYITAIANLGRRAEHRAATLEHYRNRLKRELGRRYRLNPTLPDDEYLAQLARFNPSIDIEALNKLLTQLRQPQVSEGELVQLAANVTTWLKE
ncbi:MAG: DUF4350 domain-containing protein [Anaerolineaceae bacterium]|nr:DUF4350 domain-containing protein [Anaerolineaceae bacterium]MCB9099681.1 DUF4350 domain-containing protein [Anaerolineales bacterium]